MTAAVAAGCGGGESPADRLERLGFFDHARERDAAIAEVRADPEAGIFSDRTRRFYFADAEDLTEGGVGFFLEELEPLLRKLGVAQLRVRESFGAHRYHVSVNGRDYAILEPEELESDLIWGYAAGRTVRIVNDQLRAAGSAERAYGYADPASNDFGVFVLTRQLRDAVAEILDGTADDPFEVTDEAPSFGYPEWEKGFGG